jgi:hypothetical protein
MRTDAQRIPPSVFRRKRRTADVLERSSDSDGCVVVHIPSGSSSDDLEQRGSSSAEEQRRPIALGGQVARHCHQDGRETLDEHLIFLILRAPAGTGSGAVAVAPRAWSVGVSSLAVASRLANTAVRQRSVGKERPI